ncbi:HAD family hydrolase [Paenibacillus sp. GCM10023248]|uniref:HAD family hydrolase n=1 Tax=Bacillales TaxID=1385 RepID=UPI0023787DBD|nr:MULTISPECIES: HAD-IA family hydrolase [Bacillales]MDD9267462.1 HAD-IA family hydrolase [Paenibacillus sp. MAHUQ-63]MDR6882680.1 phosphoglycolate phosphatase [Bacillus sp. 3255]
MVPKSIRGIIFDMDNTLLQSRIDFKAMKSEVAAWLAEKGLLPANFQADAHTTSTLLAYASENGATDEMIAEALRIAATHELKGMEGAGLEPGAAELLDRLYGRYKLVIVTNNSHAAAIRALQITGIKDRFDLIVGREQMEAMKPSPSGNLTVLQHFNSLKGDQWIAIGDSWIDGRAAEDAGIPFISYGDSPSSAMAEKRVRPAAHIDKLLRLLDYI